MNIPMVDLVEQYKTIKKEIDQEINKVLQTGRFIMGPNVEAFNKEMADYTETKYGIGCASGTDALQLCLMAIDIKPGDEVITTPFTFVATAEVIALLGAKPVYVDIEEDSYLIDVDKIENAITDKTRAIIPVHLFGQAADMDHINKIAKKHNFYVIEDACQAVGAKYKSKSVCSLGDLGCLSYFPAKNLGAFGDGGHVLTSNKKLADKVRTLMDHGSDKRYHHSRLGINSRLDALQAAILRVKLKYIDQWNEARKDRAALYTELLKDAKVQTPVIKEYNDHVFHQYSIQVEDRDGLQEHLKKAGIASAIHYPIPLHLQPAYKKFSDGEGSFPISEKTAKHIISLPMYPELGEKEIQFIARTITEYTG
ncbi:MAG: DegT/DnrJ/EryC1/StrS family aminotransferase [bacterium]